MRRLMALAIVMATAVQAPGAQTPGARTFLIVVDELHLDFRQTPRTRKLMQDLLAGLAREGDVWSVVTTGSSSLRLSPTTDMATVRSSISRVVGDALKMSDQLAPTTPEPQRRAEVAYEVAAGAIAQLAAVPNHGPLAVLYLSRGYDTRAVAPPSAVIDAAIRARARVIPIRPWTEGPPAADVPQDVWEAYVTATQESLRSLAEQTGGAVVFSPGDPRAVIDRVLTLVP
jgi:hypothetical protein